MSYVRFTQDGSEVYVYAAADNEFYCQHLDPEWDTFGTSDPIALLQHLEDCRDAGMVVPDWVFDTIPIHLSIVGEHCCGERHV